MSEAYANSEANLVSKASGTYSRVLDGTIALTVVSFTIALLSLVGIADLAASGAALAEFLLTLLALVVSGVVVVGAFSYANVTPITSQRVRGTALGLVVSLTGLTVAAYVLSVNLATLLGLVLVFEAGVIAVAGTVSWLGVVDTEPSSSAGVLSGAAFGVIGLLIGVVVGGSLVGFGSLLSYGIAAVVGVGLFALGTLPREDIGSTLPVALVVGSLGLTVATAVMGVGWQWNPENLSGGFTGGAVIPVFVVFGAIVSAWAAAKCRAGFGARGRQYGAFLVINLNAFLMVAVMATIVVFVTVKGTGYALHGFSISALSALALLSPALVATISRARSPAGTDAWASSARQFFRVLPLAVVGSLVGLLSYVLATGQDLVYEYQYSILQNRQQVPLDTSISLTAEPAVGTVLLLLPTLLLTAVFYRRYGTLRNVGSEFGSLATVRQATPFAVGGGVLLALVFAVLGRQPFGLPLSGSLGMAAISASTLAAGALAVLPLYALSAGAGATRAERAQDGARLFVLGVFGALGLLLAAVLIETTAQFVPSFGPVTLVPTVALVAAVLFLVAAGLVAGARRSTDERLTEQLLGEELALCLLGGAGALALLALHVALTGVAFALGPVTVANEGTLSWPMILQAYIPLGADPGGIMPAVVGTVWLVVGSMLFAVPLGLGAAIFLTEYAEQGRFTGLVEIATNALWSTPSIVFGLFGAAFLIPRLGGNTTLLAGMLVLGFMLLPLVLITSREAIKAVPDEYRDASAAMGVDRWTTIRSVVIPAAMPGVITGIILGVGRIAGETAPLILVLGSTLNETQAVDVLGGFRFVAQPPFVVNDALMQSSAALPTQVWAVIAAGVSGSPSRGWASAFILLMVVLTFYAIGITARTYFRRKISYE